MTLYERFKNWVKGNLLVLIYSVFAVLIETTAVFVVEKTPFMERPYLSLGALCFVCGIILLIPNNRAKTVVCTVMLALQAGLDLVFSVIYDMTGQYFDLGMFNLRNDAFAILENIPVNFITFYVGLFFTLMFLVIGLRLSFTRRRVGRSKKSTFFYVGLMLAGIATFGISFISYFPRESEDKYDQMLAGKQAGAYKAYGMVGNLLGEFGKAIFQSEATLEGEDINEFLYEKTAEKSEYFGISKDKNVIVILAESLEWFTFLRGEAEGSSLTGEYPNAMDIPQEVLEGLYPNLTAYYNESVVMANFHSREKTDIAEVLSMLGNYPTGAYVNYDYAENVIPYTLPNILKSEVDGEIRMRSYHNGFKSFYNREQAHQTFGLEGLTDMYDLEEMSKAKAEEEGVEETFRNYMDDGERNLDSEMIKTAKEEMFPKDERFFTYITTITMHGMYKERENLKAENHTSLAEKLTLLEAYKPTDEGAADYKSALALYYYMTTGLELDYMLGCMKEDLQSKGIWENTTILLFGDHNAYYQDLSNYVKDIGDMGNKEKKYTDLYNIPMMIHDTDLVKKIAERGEARIINKFTCTADIVPTLLDLLGIRYFENLYYGHSVFSDKQSVLYSRAYGVFIGDGIVRRSVLGDYYLFEGETEGGALVADTLSAFEREGEALVKKIEYCDYIFRQDHFADEENYQKFVMAMERINS